MKKILFSPVGGTDPISNFRDGAVLHICRVYQPEVLYLYLSKEMCEFHHKDNRYLYCLERLQEKLNFEMEIHVLERPDLENVQVFDTFIVEFRQLLREINEKYSEKELYLNVSSGTPAMKSALQTLAVLSEFSMIPIQVSTPVKRINDHVEDKVNYEVESYWELNEDNEENFENRCVQSEGFHLLAEMKKEIIIKHIRAYDYVAALQVAETIKHEVSEEVLHLIKAAMWRVKLHNPGVTEEMRFSKYDILPIKRDEDRAVFEAVLVLEIKRKKEEYGDFLRFVTPILCELFYRILKKQCNLDVYEFCKKKNHTYIWDKAKLNTPYKNQKSEQWRIKIKAVFEKVYCNGIRQIPVASDQMVKLLAEFLTDEKMKADIQHLREVEESVRNIAAHQIVGVTGEWIENRTGYMPEDIFSLVKKAVKYAGIAVKEEVWDSYAQMNAYIESLL